MVSGGAATLENLKPVIPIHDDLVEWIGHKDMGIGIVDFSIFGKYVVTFNTGSFPWMTIKVLYNNEIAVVGHGRRPFCPV